MLSEWFSILRFSQFTWLSIKNSQTHCEALKSLRKFQISHTHRVFKYLEIFREPKVVKNDLPNFPLIYCEHSDETNWTETKTKTLAKPAWECSFPRSRMRERFFRLKREASVHCRFELRGFLRLRSLLSSVSNRQFSEAFSLRSLLFLFVLSTSKLRESNWATIMQFSSD